MSRASCFSTLWSLFNTQFTWYESTFTYSCRGGALAESIDIITLVQLLLKISKGVIRLKTFRLYSRISDLRDCIGQPSHVLVSVSNFKSFQWILDPKSEPDTKHKASSSSWASFMNCGNQQAAGTVWRFNWPWPLSDLKICCSELHPLIASRKCLGRRER